MLFATPALYALAGLGLCQAAPADSTTLRSLEASSPSPLVALEPAPGALLLRGFADGPWAGTPEEAALGFLAARGAGLGLPAVPLSVERSST
ncbi:MAG: hypothetical protein ABIO70_35125, partial [Pseudomonadota bacterium]